MFMPFTAADLDKILAQQQQKKPAEELPIHPIRVEEASLRAFSFPTKRDWIFYLLGALFLLGVGIGALLVSRCQPQTLELLKGVLGGYVELRQSRPFGSIVISTFSSLFLFLLILFLLGFCSISQPAILLVPLFKGLGYGFAAGTLYGESGASAILQIAILMLPSILPGTLLLMLASRSALLFSTRLFHVSVHRESAFGPSIKRYGMRFLLFMVLSLLIALLDASICVKFRSLLL